MRMTRRIRRMFERRQRDSKKSGSILHYLKVSTVSAAFLLTVTAGHVFAMPQGGAVTAGHADISQKANTMSVTQTTNKAVINWQDFNIAANEKVAFYQPTALSVTLNRIIGNNASAIYGQLTANGKIFLVNPNGILFAPGSQVNTGGLVASTLKISDKDFSAGNYNFSAGATAGSVVNQGTITANNGGYVVLVGNQVQNSGKISATGGTAALAAGGQVSLDVPGDGTVNLIVSQSAINAAVTNSGTVQADGGQAILTGQASNAVLSSVINNSGIVSAKTVSRKNGVITLDGGASGQVQVSGVLDASGQAAGQTGGTVKVLGNNVLLSPGAKVDASGDSGGGAVLIGGNFHGSGAEQQATTTTVNNGALINANAITGGNGGNVVVWSKDSTQFAGTITAQGGAQGGNGGLVETSGKHTLAATGQVTATAPRGQAGTWLLDPYDVTIRDGGGGADLSNGTYTGTADDSWISTSTIDTALNNGTNVTITAITASGSSGMITVANNIQKTAGGDASLTLSAADNIILNSNTSITTTQGKLNVNLLADNDGQYGGYISLNAGSKITTLGGAVVLGGGNSSQTLTYPYAVSQNSGTPGVAVNGATIDTATGNGTAGGSISISGWHNSGNSSDSAVSLQGATLASGGGAITINGVMNHGTDATAGIGVSIGNSTLNAGSGSVSIKGVGGASGTEAGIDFSSGSMVTAGGGVSLTADTMLFDGGTTITGGMTGTLTISPYTATTPITVGTGSSTPTGLYLPDGCVSNTFSNFDNVVIGNGGYQGAITINSPHFSSNVSFLEASNATGNIYIEGGLLASGYSVTLAPGTGGVTESEVTGLVYADALDLQNSNADFVLNSGSNAVGQLAGFVKTVSFKDNASLTVGSVGSDKGLTLVGSASAITTTSGNAVTIQNNITKTGPGDTTLTVNSGGNITVNSSAVIAAAAGAGKFNVAFIAPPTGNGAVKIDGLGTAINTNGGNLTVIGQTAALTGGAAVTTSGGNIQLTGVAASSTTGITLSGGASMAAGAGNITLQADAMSLTDTTATVTSSGVLTIEPGSEDGSIGIGGGNGNLQIPTAAFPGVFRDGFSQITIGRADGTGAVTIAGTLAVTDPLTIEAPGIGGTITFNQDAVITTGNNSLTLTAPTITFPGSGGAASLSAGGSGLTLNADSIANWSGVSFLNTNQGGTLTVAPLTASQPLYIGGSGNSGSLSVTNTALTQIGNGPFAQVNLGRTDGTGDVTLDSFTTADKVNIISPGGDATIVAGAHIKSTSNPLTFQVKSLTELSSAIVSIDQLFLNGSDGFSMDSPANTIGTLAANVGSLDLNNSGDLTVGTVGTGTGISATGTIILDVAPSQTLTIGKSITSTGGSSAWIELMADVITGNGNVRTKGPLQLSPATSNDSVSVGGSASASALNLTAGSFANGNQFGGSYSNIYLGGNYTQDVSVTNTTFTAPLTIHANGNANFSGTVNIGTASPWKDLTIYAAAANIPADTTINAATVNLQLNTLSGILGTINGSDTLSINDQTNDNVYLTNSTSGYTGYTGTSDYLVPYTLLNNNFKGFQQLVITSGQDMYLDDAVNARLNVPVNLTAADNVYLAGNLTVGNNSAVTVTTYKTFQVNTGSSLDIGGGSFTLAADRLIQQSSSGTPQITGAGALTVQQADTYTPLAINASGTGTGLAISNAQINGGLFGTGFSNFTLGNADSYATTVTLDGASFTNNVVVQSGSGGDIKIGSGNLTVGDSTHNYSVTLKAGTITNNGNLINANGGTINLYTDNLNLSGTNEVTGSGTLGISTYNGAKTIMLGTDNQTGGLHLPDSYFTGSSSAFGSGFTAYSIGNSSQSGTLYVNTAEAYTKNVTLTTGTGNIEFDGPLTMGTGTTLTFNTAASGSVIQTAGGVTAPTVTLSGGTFNLNSTSNRIDTLAANAVSVNLQDSSPLTVGTVGTLKGIHSTGKAGITIRDTSTTSPALTVNQPITADNNAPITLIADTMNFGNGKDIISSAGGVLTVEQNTAGGTLSIGGSAGSLQLGSGLFSGANQSFETGFSSVTLGNTTGKVELAGTINFNDPTVIRGDTITLDSGSTTTMTNNKSLQFIGTTVTSADSTATVNTGSGDLTFTVDNLFLTGSNSAAPMQGTGALTIAPNTADRPVLLGPTTGPDTALVLPSGYFDGSNTPLVFKNGFSQIDIGGTTTLTQSGTTTFSAPVVLTTSKTIEVGGTITTPGKSITISTPGFTTGSGSVINANGGAISLTADTMNLASGSQVKSTNGQLTLAPLSANTNISLDGTGTGSGLSLNVGDFSGANPIFQTDFSSITIGSGGTGTLTVAAPLVVHSDLTLQETGSGGTVQLPGSGSLDLNGHNLTVNANGDIGGSTGMGAIKDVAKLDATSTKGNIYFTNPGDTIDTLGSITAYKTISIQDGEAVTIAGNISNKTTGQTITVETIGSTSNLTVGSNATITSAGNTPVYLASDGANFINDSSNSSSFITQGSGGRWVVYSVDSPGDTDGNLTATTTFRRYGTTALDTADLKNGGNGYNYSGDGFAHQAQPVITITGTKTYGEGNSSFDPTVAASSDLTHTTSQDKAFLNSIGAALSQSANFDMKTISTGTNVNQGGTAYGTGNANADLQATYGGPNPLNYKIQTQFWIDPVVLTVKAGDDSKAYDGQAYHGGSLLAPITGFVNGDQATNILSGSLSYGGVSQGAVNVGRYSIMPGGLTSSTPNYSIRYVPGTLTVNPVNLTITAADASKAYNGQAYRGGNGISSYVGFVPGDNPSVLGGSLAYSGTSQGAVNVGSYAITPGGLTSANYNITYVNGTLTVESGSLTYPPQAQDAKDNAVGTATSNTANHSSVNSDANVAPIVELGGHGAGIDLGLLGEGAITVNVSVGNKEADAYGDLAPQKRAKSIPVFVKKNNEIHPQGLYDVSYNQSSLTLIPSTENIPPVPKLSDGVGVSSSFELNVSGTLSKFEVQASNEIIRITPMDDAARELVQNANRTATRLIAADGLLTAVNDLNVMPDQVLAVFILADQ